jgi:hypothetical protein
MFKWIFSPTVTKIGLEPKNLLIIYDEDNKEKDRVPLPAKFNNFLSSYTTATKLCEFINFCNNIMHEKLILIYINKDENPNIIAILKTLECVDTGRKLPINTTSKLPVGCGLVLLYKNDVEVYVY